MTKSTDPNNYLMSHETALETRAKKLDRNRVLAIANSLNLSDAQSILHFGTSAQQQLTSVSNHILEGMSSDEAGQAGQLLNQMVAILRGFRGSELRINEKPSFFAKIFHSAGKPINDFLQKFDSVSEEIDQVSNALESHKQKLLIDLKSMDHLYDANLNYFHELDYYIAAAEEVITRLNDKELPKLEKRAEKNPTLENTQLWRDGKMQRDELERRLHDLRLTRQVALQALPSIRMIQENNKGLVSKINSTLINTLPLWRQQIAQSMMIFRSGEAAIALRESSNLTNELLLANARGLKEANRESREQIERGVFDIEAIETANKMLIETIEESLSIHENAREQRIEATHKLQAAEAALKNSLQHASKITQGTL